MDDKEKIEKLEKELDQVKEELYSIKFSRRKIDSELLELVQDIQIGLETELETLKEKENNFDYEVEIDYMKTFIKNINNYIKEFRKSYKV